MDYFQRFCEAYGRGTSASAEIGVCRLCSVASQQWQPLFIQPALVSPVSEGGIPSAALPQPLPDTIPHPRPRH